MAAYLATVRLSQQSWARLSGTHHGPFTLWLRDALSVSSRVWL